MPDARPFAPTLLWRAAFIAAALAACLAAASFVTTDTTRACPMSMPVPLRNLYVMSDLVVVGSFGETTAVEMTGFEESMPYERYLMRTELKVSSMVKGAGNYSTLHFYHSGWKFNERTGHTLSQYQGDDKLLIFLKRREGGDGYEQTDDSHGIKKLTDAALKVYVQRLDELGLIMQQAEPDPARIVEWLVRCAEEPETRWEGLYELSRSNDALLAESLAAEKKQEDAKLEAEAEKGEANHAVGAEGETGGDDKEPAGEPDDTSAEVSYVQASTLPAPSMPIYPGPDPNLIKLLTAEQKSRLANMLFSAKTITHNEITLISLVRQWGDPRLVPFVMSQLSGFRDNPPYEVESLVNELAEILGDKELAKLAESYCEQAAYEDPDPASADDEEEAEEVAVAVTETEDGKKEEEEEQPVYGSSAEQRTVRLERFIARAEIVLAR